MGITDLTHPHQIVITQSTMKARLLFSLALLPTLFVGDSLSADTPAKPRVLILGDSISIAYTPFVRAALFRTAT